MDIETLLALWDVPPDTRADPVADFAAVYADPVRINGTLLSPADVADRARELHAAFTGHEREILEVVSAGPTKLAVAFRLTADHTGPWATALGILEPTGKRITATVIDVLTVTDGRISEIVMVADELGRLRQAGVV
jgi:predicted ester cyclase